MLMLACVKLALEACWKHFACVHRLSEAVVFCTRQKRLKMTLLGQRLDSICPRETTRLTSQDRAHDCNISTCAILRHKTANTVAQHHNTPSGQSPSQCLSLRGTLPRRCVVTLSDSGLQTTQTQQEQDCFSKRLGDMYAQGYIERVESSKHVY